MAEIDEFAFEGEEDSDKQVADLIKERNRLGRKLRETMKVVEELTPFKVSAEKATREGALTESFKAAGVNPKHVTFFAALNPEAATVTKEAVAAFAAEYELPVTEVAAEEGAAGGAAEGTAAPAAAPSKIVTVPAGQAATQSGQVTRGQLDKMIYEDPARANTLIAEGRVDWTAKD